MKKSQTQKTSRAIVEAPIQHPKLAMDLEFVPPDTLADFVSAAMADVHLEERSRVYDGLLASLKAAGVNIGQLLFVLGIPARTIDELTAPEIAKVIRYVRINDSKAMSALNPFLSDFLAVHAKAFRSSRFSNSAA